MEIKTKIKFCGLMRAQDIDFVNEVKPDFAGFILSKPFRRYVAPKTAGTYVDTLSKEIKAVGVFVDEPLEYITDSVRDAKVAFVQLHGSESDEFIQKVKDETGLPVIKAFKIENAESIENAKKSKADFVLLDSGTGTGEKFDWSLLKDIGRPFFLAGGLNPANIENAVFKIAPFAVDTSSGIEENGVKSLEKMTIFVKSVRSVRG